MVEIKRVMINGRWPLNLPKHRAERESWPYWEATRLAAMHHYIQPGDLVYDIGAEAGDFSALFQSWGADVVLIEPNPKAWPTIKATWEANFDEPPRFTFEGLISTNGEPAAIERVRYRGWPDSAFGDIDEAHGFHFIGQHDDPTTDLNHLWHWMDWEWPEVITMDVEGGEGHVLSGADELIQYAKPAVFMSIHPQFMADLYGEHPKEIHDAMKAYGYHGRFLCEDHEQHWVWTHRDSPRPFPGVAEDYYIPGDRIVL